MSAQNLVSISNYKEEIINLAALGKEENQPEEVIEELLKIEDEIWTTFHLNNANPEIANILRTVINSEVPNFVLTFDIEDVESNSPLIWANIELIRYNINAIKIDQNKDLDKIYQLSKKNDTQDDLFVKAAELGLRHSRTAPILFLRPNTYINIKKIYVKEGIGLQSACFKLPIKFRYDTMDYTNVDYVIDEKLTVNLLVKTEDLDLEYGFDKRILIAPSETISDKSNSILENSKMGYDKIIRKPIKTYSTNEITPKDYYLGFKFVFNTDVKAFYRKALSTIIKKLDEALLMTFFTKESDTLTITLPNHTQVYCFLIARGIYEIKVPKNLSTKPTSFIGIGASITITDPDAERLYKESIKKNIEIFKGLISSFS